MKYRTIVTLSTLLAAGTFAVSATPAMAKSEDVVYTSYEEILYSLKEAVEKEEDVQVLVERDLSDVYVHTYSSEEPLARIGYVLKDLNGDEDPELLIGEVGEKTIYDLFANVDGKPVHIACGGERNFYGLAENIGDLVISQHASSSAATSRQYYWTLKPNENKFTIRTGFVYDAQKSPDEPYYIDYGLCTLDHVTEDIYNDRIAAFSDDQEIDYLPLSEYDGKLEGYEAPEAMSEAESESIDESGAESGAAGSTVKSDKSSGIFAPISQEEAKEMMQQEDGHVIVDVRTQEEYDEGHIPGAILIPNETIGNEEPAELPDKDQIILIYCRSGNRSKQAAQKLANMGYTKIYEFGGIKDWTGETEK